jgi:hypothetical protein
VYTAGEYENGRGWRVEPRLSLNAETVPSTLTPYFVSATGNAEVANSLSQALPLGNQALRATQMALYSMSDAIRDRLQVSSGLLSANGLSGAGANSGVWSQSFNYMGVVREALRPMAATAR